MKMTDLQMLYRDSLDGSADPRASVASIDVARLLLDDLSEEQREQQIAALLADPVAMEALRTALAVRPLAAELAREMAQADWAAQHAKKVRPAPRPAWAPFAMAASVSLFAVGAWWANQHAAPALPPSAPTAHSAPTAAPEGDLFGGSFEGDSAVASNQSSDSEPTEDRVFHDDFGS